MISESVVIKKIFNRLKLIQTNNGLLNERNSLTQDRDNILFIYFTTRFGESPNCQL